MAEDNKLTVSDGKIIQTNPSSKKNELAYNTETGKFASTDGSVSITPEDFGSTQEQLNAMFTGESNGDDKPKSHTLN